MKRVPYLTIGCVLLFTVFFSTSYAVTFTSQYNFDGSFDIYYEGQLPTGVALDITLPGGLTTDYTNVVVNPYYNFFPDYAYLQGESYVIGAGLPIADIYAPGILICNVSNFCVSMAAWEPYSAYENVYFDENLGEVVFVGPIGDLPTYDLNMDGYVDIEDVLLQNFDWLHYNESGPMMPGDFNGDSKVDMQDVGMMNGQQYLDTSSSGVLMTIEVHDFELGTDYGQVGIELNALRGGIYEIPEPASLFLLALGGLLLRKRK